MTILVSDTRVTHSTKGLLTETETATRGIQDRTNSTWILGKHVFVLQNHETRPLESLAILEEKLGVLLAQLKPVASHV